MARLHALLLALLLVTLPVAGADPEDVRPSHGTACVVPAIGSPTSPGCATGRILTVYECDYDAEGVWTCIVEYTLSVTVFGPVTCGNATSDWTSGVSACAIAGSASDQVTSEVPYHPPPEGLVVKGKGHVCAYPLGTQARTCVPWDHMFFLPGPPEPPSDPEMTVRGAARNVQRLLELRIVGGDVIVAP